MVVLQTMLHISFWQKEKKMKHQQKKKMLMSLIRQQYNFIHNSNINYLILSQHNVRQAVNRLATLQGPAGSPCL